MIEKIMSKELIIGNITDTLYDIAVLMKKYDIGFIPIAKGKQIVGVITDRDIVINAINNKAKPEESIEQYMSINLITINQNESIEKALDLMGFKKVKRLIVENHNQVVGILSISDIIKDPDLSLEIFYNNIKKLLETFKNYEELEIKEFYI